ncbi:hypothetical protein EAH89_06640 [Roseomonas nepalensis]|uniref:Uncharacterized protein n=1 Tax=Muricoccus nepalensis TaxID=1854500 RepID=A0A502GAK2_9PROT|nr:hypothetical protein [Roseomonas nepalensis]TPG59029.1 hypothetical protein EAH89_06640 [Roseomonas nepalensis]
MLRSFAIALGAVVALASVQPADAAGSRQEARSAGKAARPAAARPAAARATAPRGPRAAEAAPARRPAFAVRGSGRAQALRYADRRPATMGGQGRMGLRFVSLLSAAPAAAATVPARGGKYAKAAYTSARAEGADEGRAVRRGAWHAGLPAADGEQMDCPAGTMAVLASGHVDTFRCMPM